MTRLIKVCFVHGNGYAAFNRASKAPIGGVEVQFGILARWLSERSWDVSFIVADWGQPQRELRDGINILRSYSSKRNLVNIVMAPWQLWRALGLSGADVYIMSSVGPEIGLVSWFCKVYGRKLIYLTAHDIDCDGEYRRGSPIKGMIFEYGLRQANLLIAQKVEHAEALKHYYGLGSIVIKSGWPAMSYVNGERDYVLWVARCEAWKNPLLFVEIARRLPARKFVMIFPLNNNVLSAAVRKQAELLDNLTLAGEIEFGDLQSYYNRARIFVSTSESEGWPATFLQACESGVPIVSYKVNPDGFITNNLVGYCANGDLSQVVGYIAKLFEDEDDWREKSDRAREYVRKNHALDIGGERWEAVIRKVAGEN